MTIRRALTAFIALVLGAGAIAATTATGAAAQPAPPDTLVPQNHTPDGLFQALPQPERVLDTRAGQIAALAGGRFAPGQAVDVQMAGVRGLPAASVLKAVALNATATQTSGNGFFTLWPAGSPRPTTSNVNYTGGVDVPNFVIVPIGPDGRLSVYNGAIDGVARSALLLDVVGYYTTAAGPAVGGSFAEFAERFFDSRSPANFSQRGAGAVNFLAPGQWRKITDSLYNPRFPTYLFNVTVTQSSGNGYLSVVPGNRVGQPAPSVSNLNFRSGVDVANMVIIRPDANGEFSIYNGGTGALHVIFDFVGAYDNGAQPARGSLVTHPAGPFRFFDSRNDQNQRDLLIENRSAPNGFIVGLDLDGDPRIPTTALALVINVTAIPNPTTSTAGYLTVFSTQNPPDTSTLNFRPGQVIPNLTVVGIEDDRTLRIFASTGSVYHLLIDVMGWIE